CVLAAHNAPFDIAFLTAGCRACNLAWPPFRVLDTVELAHRGLGEKEVADCKLATLAAHFGARTKPRHRALPDPPATAEGRNARLRRLAARGIRTLAEAGFGDGRTEAGTTAAPAGAAPDGATNGQHPATPDAATDGLPGATPGGAATPQQGATPRHGA